jgi:hypothetical protein
MEYLEVVLAENDKGDSEPLRCPVCGAVWLAVVDGAGKPCDKPCEHYMFVWEQVAEAPTCFNGLTVEKLYEQIADQYKAANPEDDDMDTDEIVEDVFFEQEFWESLKLEEVDLILDHTIGCGPSSYTALYGVRKG